VIFEEVKLLGVFSKPSKKSPSLIPVGVTIVCAIGF